MAKFIYSLLCFVEEGTKSQGKSASEATRGFNKGG